MHVTVSKIHETLFSGEALSVSADTTEGRVGILPKHEPFVANLKSGTVTVRTSAEEKNFEVSAGVIEVAHNRVTVLL